MRRAVAAGALVGLAAALGAVLVLRPAPVAEHSWPVPGDAGPRIMVEVLNGSDIDGLARAVTRRLRREGLDVVAFGTAAERTDSTVLYIRRGDSAAAVRVRRALGAGRIVRAWDPRRLLDVSVVLGPDVAGLVRDP